MLILNFSHPITEAQRMQIANIAGDEEIEVLDFPVQFKPDSPFTIQVKRLMQSVPLGRLEEEHVVVNLPALNYIAAMVLAALMGAGGYMPPVLRLQRIDGSLPPTFSVAEIVKLETVVKHYRRA